MRLVEYICQKCGCKFKLSELLEPQAMCVPCQEKAKEWGALFRAVAAIADEDRRRAG